jgi:hypothetical protein
MDRRRFCQSAAAAIGTAAVGAPSHASALAQGCDALPILAVLHDERYADAREFAFALRQRGALAFPISGSSAGHWYGELAALLRRKRGRVAGFTSYADLLVARYCGRELGQRLIFEGSHDARGGDEVRHRYRLIGVGPLSELWRVPPKDHRELAAALARIGQRSATSSRIERQSVEASSLIETSGPKRPDHPGFLTSWLLETRS